MEKFHTIIHDRNFQEMHHALGCPWPEDIMSETYRNYFATSEGSDEAERMKASDHWTGGSERFGCLTFSVTEKGRIALRNYILDNVTTPNRYTVTFHHHSGETIVRAKTRSGAKYSAYLHEDTGDTFKEYLMCIKSVRLYQKGRNND